METSDKLLIVKLLVPKVFTGEVSFSSNTDILS